VAGWYLVVIRWIAVGRQPYSSPRSSSHVCPSPLVVATCHNTWLLSGSAAAARSDHEDEESSLVHRRDRLRTTTMAATTTTTLSPTNMTKSVRLDKERTYVTAFLSDVAKASVRPTRCTVPDHPDLVVLLLLRPKVGVVREGLLTAAKASIIVVRRMVATIVRIGGLGGSES
jgi:hypothetical protein